MRTTILAGAAILLSTTGTVRAQEAPRGSGEIVVTATSLASSKKALEDCLARRCAPDREIAAAIAHAENQFVAGRYEEARATLTAASRRNKRHAGTYPVPVADLLRAGSRVAAHLGESRAFFHGALDVVSALKKGLPDQDPQVLAARVELADAYVRTGRWEEGSNLYEEVAEQAKRLKLPMIEAQARFRDARLWSTLARTDSSMRAEAKAKVAAIAASADRLGTPFARAADMLTLHLEARNGDPAAVDTLLAQYRGRPTDSPLLITAEPIKLPFSEVSASQRLGGAPVRLVGTAPVDQWIDVRFLIDRNGKPVDVEIVRESEKARDSWGDAVLEAIRSRRYAPLALEPGQPGVMRVERYTYTAGHDYKTGSRLRVRSETPRIEMLDLSVETAARAGGGSGSGA